MESYDSYLRERLGLAVAERAARNAAQADAVAKLAKRWVEANLGVQLDDWQAAVLVAAFRLPR